MDSDSQLVIPCLLFLTIALQGVSSEGNLAFGKDAIQKSTMRHWNGHTLYNNSAGRAVDGLIHTIDPEDGCTSTADSGDTEAWWMVDLGRVYVITNITVFNRRGSFFRLRDFWIRVGYSSDITRHTDCTFKSGWIGQGASETFTCDTTLSGRWVSIQRTNDLAEDEVHGNGNLQLCEVQVYGYEYIELPITSRQTKILTYKTTQQGVTSDTCKCTSSGPEILQVKACGWPASAVVTSALLGILHLIVLAVYFIKIRKRDACFRKGPNGRKDNDPVSTGCVSMTGLGQGEDYEPVQPAGTQTHSASNYEQEDPVHYQSPDLEDKKYVALNREQITSQVLQAYECLGQP